MRVKKAKNILVLIFAVSFIIFIAEKITGTICPSVRSPIEYFSLNICGSLVGEYDEHLFWRLKGVRPPFDGGTEQNMLKVICLTDSVSVMYDGKGYPEILEDILRQHIASSSPKVFNAGVPGYTSHQGLRYLRDELLIYKPHIVTVCYGWNDHWQAAAGKPDAALKIPRNHFLRRALSRSKVFRCLYAQTMKRRQSRYSCVGPWYTMRVSLSDYKKNLEEIARLCRENNIMLILMTAPYLDCPQDWVPAHRAYNDVVRDIARENAITLVDPVEIFLERDDLFLDPSTDPVHYNWEGSRVIARGLAERIISFWSRNLP